MAWVKCGFKAIIPSVPLNVIAERYDRYRQEKTSAIVAFLFCIGYVLLWTIFCFESPSWQKVRARHNEWFPHISSDCPRFADGVRYAVQSLWLVIVRQEKRPSFLLIRRAAGEFFAWCGRQHRAVISWLHCLPERVHHHGLNTRSEAKISSLSPRLRKVMFILGSLLAAILAIICISQPFDLFAQFIFVLLLWGIAMVVRRIPGRFSSLMMIVLSLTISCRYIWWRYTSTLNWDDPLSLICGLLLLAAETYAWVVLLLGYFQSVWPLHRKPVPLPENLTDWPSVDIMIPTYNEGLNVVKPTIYAALGVDWPQDKRTIYILDDGNRAEFRAFAEEVGVRYIARPTHEHAKAGNINHALKQATSEFVSIFDCDHVPTRSFLQLTMGWFFKDKKLGMLQTPHHFFSPDPFERNLNSFRHTPNEGTLFYGLVQDGNDMWNAAFFCGSCAIMRRSALNEIKGIAVETVTEDAHTSLRLHRRGYTSAYIRIPLAAGLATETLSAHISQRIRWARGMVQIFRLDNPLFGKGLKLVQRLCYANAMLHFLSGIPRLIFLTAPLAFLFFHAYIIYAPALAIALYVLPHMIHASLTNSRIQGKFRHSFWSEIYETVLAWYIARPTTVALFYPLKGTFNVTAKGGMVEESHLDWGISRPYFTLVILNLVGIIAGCWKLYSGPADEIPTVLVSMTWVAYNLIILGGAVAVSIEAKQIRHSPRIQISMPAAIAREDGHLFPCTLRDYSDGGVGVEMGSSDLVKQGDELVLILKRGEREFAFHCQVMRVSAAMVGVSLKLKTTQENIDFMQCTFARADTWALWQEGVPEDKPMQSLGDVFKLGFRGYQRMIEYSPPLMYSVLSRMISTTGWVISFLPHRVNQPKEEVA
ncbi:UDP-forming cellulose synthase catalytic subunit [Budvicia diplopodorum]|uniref:UDP-forming cellulose synthase catalytic subunit n=1 Tax=Budvicia diplopodorum TaxID=1119056 RepID=UPI0013583CD3|nr:UDP-forming cellulose synthase catalytic subunit [Budvicia diplopodorum]